MQCYNYYFDKNTSTHNFNSEIQGKLMETEINKETIINEFNIVNKIFDSNKQDITEKIIIKTNMENDFNKYILKSNNKCPEHFVYCNPIFEDSIMFAMEKNCRNIYLFPYCNTEEGRKLFNEVINDSNFIKITKEMMKQNCFPIFKAFYRKLENKIIINLINIIFGDRIENLLNSSISNITYICSDINFRDDIVLKIPNYKKLTYWNDLDFFYSLVGAYREYQKEYKEEYDIIGLILSTETNNLNGGNRQFFLQKSFIENF